MKVEDRTAKCPICDRASSPLFSAPCDYRKPANSKLYEVYWCHVCEYGQIWERPTKDEVSSFYILDDYYTHNSNITNAGSRKNYDAFLDRLRMHISWRIDKGEELAPGEAISLLKDDSRTMIEIGCGNGTNLLKFLTQGFSVVGVEPDPKAREVAKNSGVKVFEGTAENLPIEVQHQKFDIVLMSHVLEHCIDINSAVSNAKKLLNTGGIFIVETPNCKAHGFRDYKAAWPWSDIPRHLNFFTPSSLNLIVKKQGFHVVSEKYRGFCRQFTKSWLENEKEIWRAFAASGLELNIRPNFKRRNWKLLFKSLLTSKASKYDSVRIIAKNV